MVTCYNPDYMSGRELLQYDVAPVIDVAALPVEQTEQAHQAVLKLASRCPLNCDYCYVYNSRSGDQSWRAQPAFMSDETSDMVAERLGEELNSDPPREFDVTLHGGEPTNIGAKNIGKIACKIREAVSDETYVRMSIQTSATRLDTELLDTFRQNRIGVGISLDGDQNANRSRLYPNGKASFPDVMQSLGLIYSKTKYLPLLESVFAVVNLENDPKETFDFFLDMRPPQLDVLLPHGNWRYPPPGLATQEDRDKAPYGRWMADFFDAYYPEHMYDIEMRRFDSLISSMRKGTPSRVASLGGYQGGIVFIETDGSYEMVDALKTVPGEVGKTGLNVYEHSIRQASAFMAQKAIQLAASELPQGCAPCPISKVCGGGDIAQRYDTEQLFDKRSIYCQDLAYLITHIQGRVRAEVGRQSILNSLVASGELDFTSSDIWRRTGHYLYHDKNGKEFFKTGLSHLFT